MHRNKKKCPIIYSIRWILPVFFMLFLISFEVKAALAEDFLIQLSYNNYCLKGYDIQMKVNRDNCYEVTEKILADFEVPKHGLYRDIPILGTTNQELNGKTIVRNYQAKVSEVSVINGENGEAVPYELFLEGDSVRVKVGDSHKEIIGNQSYVIHYHYKLMKQESDGYDQFYYNLIGNGWDTSISHISFNIQMPSEVSKDKLSFYVGKNGSVDSSGVNVQVKGDAISGTLNRILDPGEGFTVRLMLPKGYFQTENSYAPWSYMILFAVLTIISLILWLIWGKTSKIKRVMEYVPPENINPADANYILKGSLSNSGITALFLYWAEGGYIDITAEDKSEFCLIKKKECDQNMKSYEQVLFKKLFAESYKVTTSDLRNNFQPALNEIKSGINEYHKNQGLEIFHKKGRLAMKIGYINSALIISLLSFYAMNMFSYGIQDYVLEVLLIPMILGLSIFCSLLFGVSVDSMKIGKPAGIIAWGICYTLILLIFALQIGKITGQELLYYTGTVMSGICTIAGALSDKRTLSSEILFQKLMGLRDYICELEKHKFKSSIEKSNIEFYQILPFAYVIGVSKKWIVAFQGIIKDPPTWYMNGNDIGFDYNNFSTHLTHFMVNYESSMTNGDSQGGGSSGGGEGGGGGGSW